MCINVHIFGTCFRGFEPLQRFLKLEPSNVAKPQLTSILPNSLLWPALRNRQPFPQTEFSSWMAKQYGITVRLWCCSALFGPMCAQEQMGSRHQLAFLALCAAPLRPLLSSNFVHQGWKRKTLKLSCGVVFCQCLSLDTDFIFCSAALEWSE